MARYLLDVLQAGAVVLLVRPWSIVRYLHHESHLIRMHKFFSWITLIYPCILFFFISCNDNASRQYLIKAKKAKDARAYSLKIDSIQIPIANSDYSTIYYTYSTYSVNGTDYLVGYNSRHTSLDIFNLTRRSAVKQVNLSADSFFLNKLDKQDLNKGKSITDICIINLDSIIFHKNLKHIIVRNLVQLGQLIKAVRVFWVCTQRQILS